MFRKLSPVVLAAFLVACASSNTNTSNPDDPNRRGLQIISEQIVRMNGLLDKLLDLSRITAERVRIDRRPADLLQPRDEVAEDDHLLEHGRAGRVHEHDGIRPPVIRRRRGHDEAVHAQMDGGEVDPEPGGRHHREQRETPADVATL